MSYEIEKMLQHLTEMLEMRGDDVSEFMEHGEAVLLQDPSKFITDQGDHPVALETDKTAVVFALTKENAKRLLSTIHKDLTTKEKLMEKFLRTNIILVLSEMPISSQISSLQQKEKLLDDGMIQIFLKSELMYNPSKHELVPKHEKISETEIKDLLDKYNLRSKAQLPAILKTDVMARWLGLRSGDIVKITRYNETSGLYYYYRCCT